MSATERSARISYSQHATHIEVEVDGNLGFAEIAQLTRDIVGVIERLTGHPCLSGTHEVLMKPHLADVLDITFD